MNFLLQKKKGKIVRDAAEKPSPINQKTKSLSKSSKTHFDPSL